MHVGVDFGDIWMRAARVSGPQGQPCAIPDLREPRELATRLCVQVDAEGALVGDIAAELQREHPTTTVVSDLRSRLINEAALLPEATGREWFAEGLAGLCLRKLRRDVAGLGIGDWNSTTLTVPANASSLLRERLQSAARLADLSHVCLLEEPIAAWCFVNASSPARGLPLVLQVDELSSTVTLIDGNESRPRVLISYSLPRTGGSQAEQFVVEQLERDLDPATARAFDSGTSIRDELHRELCRERMERVSPSIAVARRAWLHQGTVSEVLLRRSLWEQAWSPIRETLMTLIRQTVQQAGVALRDVRQVILVGAAVSECEIEREVTSLFPQATLWHRPELAAWLPAYGASLVGPSHPAWKIEESSVVSSEPIPADVGILILNPVTRQPDLDVLLPKGTQPPDRATRHYQPQPGQSMFTVELVQRQIQSPGYRSLSRWEIPLAAGTTRPSVQVTCELLDDRHLEVTLGGDLAPSAELRRRISLDDPSTTGREASQRTLLETTSWRD